MSEVLGAAGDVVAGNTHDANAKQLRKEAKLALAEGYADEEMHRRQSRQLFGLAAAQMAEGGSGYEGSNALLLKQSEVLSEYDALKIRYQARQRSRGLKAAARNEGALATQAYIGAGANLLLAGTEGSNTRTLTGI